MLSFMSATGSIVAFFLSIPIFVSSFINHSPNNAPVIRPPCSSSLLRPESFQGFPSITGMPFVLQIRSDSETMPKPNEKHFTILQMTDGDFFADDMSEDKLSDTINDGDSNGIKNKDEENLKQSQSINELAESSVFEDHIPKVNTVTLTGRIGQPPDPRYLDDGKVVLTLSLAVKRKYHPLERKVRNINYGEEETDWFSLELWGRDAEFASKYVTKGARVGVTGSLAVDSWVDRNSGEDRMRYKVSVKHLDILESRAEAQLRQQNSGYSGGYKNYDNSSGYSGGGGSGGYYDGDDSSSSAGTGGFFD